MQITTIDMAQISIETIGGVITLLFAMIILLNHRKNRVSKYFIALFIVTSLIFFSEALVYYFRGNTDMFSLIGNRAGNFIGFILNVVLAILFNRFIQVLLEERGVKVSSYYKRGILFVAAVAVGIVVLNLFTEWMYYFDVANRYHRASMWYFYTLLCFLMLLTGMIISIKNHKTFGTRMCIAVVIFVFVPIVSVVIQALFYGISIVNIGLAVSVILMFFTYLYDWNKHEKGIHETASGENKIINTFVMFFIMAICISASIVSCIIFIYRIAEDVTSRNNEITALMTEEGIVNEFLRPIIVSEAMSYDATLKESLKISQDKESAKAIEQDMVAYLTSIKTGMGYQMAFAVSEASCAYYTYNGVSKFLDPEKDDHDVWYRDSVRSGQKYVLNVDTDEDNNWSLSIFVNTSVMDEDGTRLGCCGVGVQMGSVQELIAKYEEENDIRIFLTNRDGLIQVSSDGARIEKEYVDNSHFYKTGSEKFYAVKEKTGTTLIKYIPQLGWHLVIVDPNPNKISVSKIVLPNIIIFLLGILVLGIALYITVNRERRIERELIEKKRASVTDGLTGLKNRRGYEEDIEPLKLPGGLKGVSLVMLDVNGLKYVNDNIGHSAGDELIKGAAACIKEAAGEYGVTYRTGGDEFVAILRTTPEQVRKCDAHFQKLTKEWKGELVEELSISEGVVICDEHPDITFLQATDLADKYMYEDKDRYYKETGRNRRKG